MSCVHDAQWETKDGQKLHLFEMTDAHLTNAKAYLERRLANKEYHQDHACDGVDLLDGPCFKCEGEVFTQEDWERWIHAFDLELRRRKADAARK